jgi:hypothetical protein
MVDSTGPGAEPALPHRAWREATVWLWVLAATAAISWLLLAVAKSLPARSYDGAPAPPPWPALTLAWWASLLLLAALALRLSVVARRGGTALLGAASLPFLLRLSADAGLAALVAGTVVVAAQPGAGRIAASAAFSVALALGFALPVGVLGIRPQWLAAPRRRGFKLLDALVFNLVVALLAAELSVLLVARYSASPLLHFDRVFGGGSGEQAVRNILRSFRLKPGTPFFDGRVNSRGYPDDEIFTARPKDFTVGVLADSFGVGVVPLAYNFTTVAERSLERALSPRFQRVAVQNFGVASIGPPEYYYLLLNEVMPTNPSLVVLCLFIGNDLGSPLARPEVSMLRLQSWRSFQLVRRLSALRETRPGGAVEFTDWGRFSTGVPPWVLDHRLERPSFSEDRFLQIELEHVGECNLGWPELPARHESACRTLKEFHAVLRDRLLVALLPDEYQVNDALWQTLLRRIPNPAVLRREYPQQQLVRCCESAGIQVLDLLPALREAQRSGPTYHLRDTHWNAHGNRAAGEAIAAWILAHRFPGVRPGVRPS